MRVFVFIGLASDAVRGAGLDARLRLHDRPPPEGIARSENSIQKYQ
jgi:hypothetical protein